MLDPIISQTVSNILAGGTDTPDDGGADKTLEDVARDEREYVRERLRKELSREPTDKEIDEWMREQTEGY